MSKTYMQFINSVHQGLKYGLKYLDMLIRYLLAAGMGLIMFAVVFHVFGRYFVGKTYMGTMEFVRYVTVWVTMLGAAAAFGANEHVSITLFKERMPETAWFGFNFTGNVMLCIFLLVMVVGGVEISFNNLNQTSLGLQISMFYPYLAVPVGGCLMLPYVLSDMLAHFIAFSSNKRTKEHPI